MNNHSRFVFLFILLTAAVYETVYAQIIMNNGGVIQFANNGAIESSNPNNNLIQAPRETLQRLKTALVLLDEKRYSESVRILWDIFKSEEDSFINVNFKNLDEEETSETPDAQSEEKPGSNNPQPGQMQTNTGSKSLIPLKMYIQNVLAQAPEEARQALELLVGVEAQNAFEAAIQSGSLDRLLTVSRDYFHTEAGYNATFLSGLILLNDGKAASATSLFDSLANTPGVRQKYEPAFSVLWLNSLILSGQDVHRRELVTQLRQRLARVDWTIDNKRLTGFDNLEQLEKYLTAFAEKSQKTDCPYSSAEPFALPRWTVPTYTNPTLEALIQTFMNNESKTLASNSSPYNSWMSVFEPAVSGNRVFFRTLFGLTAADLQTGKRIWDSSADFSSVIQDQWDTNGEYERKAISQFLYYAIAFRSKYDFTYGALRADEKSVYAIEDIWKDRIQQGTFAPSISTGVLVRSGPESNIKNRLAAYDVNTGKMKWHVGSATVSYGFTADSSLDSTTFLGAPLILEGKLYIIGMTKQASIVLYELESETGKVLWSKTLGESQLSLVNCLYNLTPKYHKGLLVCPISDSVLVCIDIRQHRLLWGFNAIKELRRNSGFIINNADFRYDYQNMNSSYSASTFQKGYNLILIDNKAFYIPVLSSEMYVINLSDGKLDDRFSAFKSQNGYYPLSVGQNEFVFLTPSNICICDIEKYNRNKHEIDSIQSQLSEKEQQLPNASPEEQKKINEERKALSDRFNQLKEQNNEAITTISFPNSARLIGRPFEYGGKWFIPLSDNTLAEFDLSKGAFVKSVTASENRPFGTVFLFSGKVFSQKYDSLDCYDVKQFIESQLQSNNDDSVRSLLAAGYVAWEKDEIELAATKFRQAADMAPKIGLPILRSLALYALKKDYNRYASLLDTFQPAFESEQGRLMLAQFKVDSFLLQNDIQGCLTTLEPVMDDVPKSNMKSCMVILKNENLSIERSIWVGSVIEKIYRAASDEQKRLIEQWAARRLDVPKEERTSDWLNCQLDFFRTLPVASELQKELYQTYVRSNSPFLAELVLRQQRSAVGATPEQIASAWAEQALLIQKSSPEDSARIFMLINRLYPDIPCCQNQTADAYVKSLGESSPVYKAYSSNYQWGQNEVQIAINKVEYQPMQTGSDQKKQFFNENIFLDGSTVRRNVNIQQNLILFDLYGRKKMLLSPDRVVQQNRVVYHRSGMNSEAPWFTAEHLFFISEKNSQMTAISFLGASKVLWSRDYDMESLGDEDENPYILVQQANQPTDRITETDQLCTVYGNIVFTQMSDGSYVGLDVITGRIRWRRKLGNGVSVVFVDNDSFYVVNNNSFLDKAGNVFCGLPEQSGERYSLYSGVHESSIRIPSSRGPVTPKGIVFTEQKFDSSTQTMNCTIRFCSVRDQKTLWEATSDFATQPVYVKSLNVLYRFNVNNGRVEIIDADTGRFIVNDSFEIMTQEERDNIVKDVNELRVRIEKENKRIEEEEKKDPNKRDERLRLQRLEGRIEDLLPENYSEKVFENKSKQCFDGIDVFTDGSSDGSFYLIVRSGFGYTVQQRRNCKQFSPMRSLHLPKARIYKFSRDGKPLWKEPLQVIDQYFNFDLPSGLPFLVLGCNRQKVINDAVHSDYEFLFVDKATGQVWKYQGTNPIGAFQCVCDPEKREVSVLISKKEVLILTFTDTPLPSDAPRVIRLLTEEEKARQAKENEELEKAKESAGADDPFNE